MHEKWKGLILAKYDTTFSVKYVVFNLLRSYPNQTNDKAILKWKAWEISNDRHKYAM